MGSLIVITGILFLVVYVASNHSHGKRLQKQGKELESRKRTGNLGNLRY